MHRGSKRLQFCSAHKLGTALLLIILGLLGARETFGAARVEAELSLAVLETSPELSPLSSLVQVELSGKGLLLVERSRLEEILQEQELSAAGLLDRKALIKVGRLLRADGFLLVSFAKSSPDKATEAQQEEKLLRIRLVETAHGVRLLDWFAAWDPGEVEQLAGKIAEKATDGTMKLGLQAGQIRPVGIVDIHRVLLGEEYQWLCRTLRAMLSSRLSNDPGLVLLEREDLKLLYEEKSLTQGDEDEFWRSSVLIEGFIQRAGKDNIELKLQLKRPSGEQVEAVSLPVDANSPRECVEEAAQKIVFILSDVPGVSSWDPEAEADEFHRQGQLLKNHRRDLDAVPLLETAHALAPENLEYAKSLFLHVVRMHRLKPAYSDLELAELVSGVVRMAQAHFEQNPPDQPPSLVEQTLFISYFTSPSSTSTDRVRDVNRDNRRIWVEMFTQSMNAARETSEEWAEGLEWYSGLPTLLAVVRSSTAEETISQLRTVLPDMIMPPGIGGKTQSTDLRAFTCFIALRAVLAYPPRHLGEDEIVFYKEWFKYLRELADLDDPVARFFACTAVLRLSPQYQKHVAPDTPFDATMYLESALGVFREHLQASDEFGKNSKFAILMELKGAIRSVLREEHVERMVDILEQYYVPLIEKGDVDTLLLWQPSRGVGFTPQYEDVAAEARAASRYVRLLRRVVDLLETKQDDEQVVLEIKWAKDVANRTEQDLRTYLSELEANAKTLEAEGQRQKALSVQRTASAIRQALRDLGGAPKAASFSVTTLLEEADWPQRWSFADYGYICSRAKLQDQVLWIAFTDLARNCRVGLAGIDLASRKVLALWQTECERDYGPREPFRALVVGEARSFVAMERIGLIEFPGKAARGAGFLNSPRILNDKHGLPPSPLTGLALQAERLWVGYGHMRKESGLGVYDPQTGKWETVFCSAIKGNTPLTAGNTYEVYELTPCPGGLLFLVGAGTIGQEWRGLWKMDLETLVPRYVGSLPRRCRIVQLRNNWWLNSPYMLARLDPHSSRIERLATGPESDTKSDTWSVQDSLFVPEPSKTDVVYGPYLAARLDLGTAAIHGRKLWARYGKDQLGIIPRGESFDKAEIIENNILDGGKVLRFLSTPYGLIAIGEGTVGLVETAGDRNEQSSASDDR